MEAAGLEVWFDKRSLKAGDDFEQKIRRAIQSCSLFVAVLSRHTSTPDDRFLWIEWRAAMRAAERIPEGRRFLIPVAVDDLGPEADFVPEAFRSLHWEQSPEGRCDPRFIEGLRDDYRKYKQWSRRAGP
jgi:hypothetical protein